MTQGTHNLGTVELLALLRDASLKAESIAEEMECAGAHGSPPEEIERARELLAKLQQESAAEETARQIAGLVEPLALALVRAAGDAQRQEALAELAADPRKAIAKEAKRELQRLKQKGIQVKELKPQGETVLKPPPEAEAPACYASSIDAYGERAVWWAQAGRGSIEVVQAVISDVKGVLAIDALALSRRSFREFARRLPRQPAVTTVEVPKDHARWLIAQAAEEGARNGFAPPSAYASALGVLGTAPEGAPRSPGESVEFGPDGEGSHRNGGAALFKDTLFMAWIPEEDPLRTFALKVDEIAVSKLYLDDAQRQQGFEHAATEASEAYFTPQRRARYARRLTEMAHVLRSEGRLDAARTALAVAHDLPAEEGARNPFCRALFTHVLEGRWRKAGPEQQAAKTTPGGLVVP
jgi:hypothetical protein